MEEGYGSGKVVSDGYLNTAASVNTVDIGMGVDIAAVSGKGGPRSCVKASRGALWHIMCDRVYTKLGRGLGAVVCVRG